MSHRMKSNNSVCGSVWRKEESVCFWESREMVTYPERKVFLATNQGNSLWRDTHVLNIYIDSVAVMLLMYILGLHHKVAVSY